VRPWSCVCYALHSEATPHCLASEATQRSAGIRIRWRCFDYDKFVDTQFCECLEIVHGSAPDRHGHIHGGQLPICLLAADSQVADALRDLVMERLNPYQPSPYATTRSSARSEISAKNHWQPAVLDGFRIAPHVLEMGERTVEGRVTIPPQVSHNLYVLFGTGSSPLEGNPEGSKLLG